MDDLEKSISKIREAKELLKHFYCDDCMSKDDLRKLVEKRREKTCLPDEYCESCAEMRDFLDEIEELIGGE